MADSGSRPGPSRRDKGKAKVWEPIELSSDDDQTATYVPGPVPRNSDMPPSHGDGCLCLSRTLTRQEVNPANPVFYLDAYEAFILTDCAEVLEPPSGSYSMSLPVFDDGNGVFDMLLSYFVNGDLAGYSITEDWGKFIKAHNLKAGDMISFYRNLDRDVLDRPYYVIKYVRISSDVYHEVMKEFELTEVKVDASVPSGEKGAFEGVYDMDVLEKPPDRKKKPGPGSRVMPDKAIFLSKTLSTFEVIHEDDHPRLYLDAYEASCLTGCPGTLDNYTLLGTLLKNLVVVFDADDMQYDMRLSRSKNEDGEIIYTLDCGWQRFVKTHGLKDGDGICVYMLLDDSVHDEHYYVIKYTRKGPSGSGMTGKEPSSSGVTGKEPSSSGVTGKEPSGSGHKDNS